MTQDQELFGPQNDFDDQTFAGLAGRDRAWTGKEFTGCTFDGSQLAGAAFHRCKFIECTFRSCDLSNISLKGSTLRDVTFEDCKLLGVNWTEVAASARLNYRRSVLSLGNFSSMDLRKWTLAACVAREVELGHANLTEADCRGTDFAGARFLQTNLTKADLRDATNYAIRPGDNVLKGAKFSLPEATLLLYGLGIEIK